MILKVKNLIQNLFSANVWSFDLGVLLLRISCGLMLLHGWSKFTNFSEGIKDWPDPLHVGMAVSYSLTVFAELFCTIFLLLGLFTRIVLIPLVILMLVIIFIIHSGEPIADREHAILYLMSYLSLFFTGPGKFSLDKLIKKN